MKMIIITALLALVTIAGQAQDVNTCQPIAERILTAAQNHSSDGIDELLAPEFHFSNIKQPIAGKVLKQIIAQMPIITKWEQSNVERDSTGLTLRYIMTESDSRTTEATFLFNADNMVVEADLLQAEISLCLLSTVEHKATYSPATGHNCIRPQLRASRKPTSLAMVTDGHRSQRARPPLQSADAHSRNYKLLSQTCLT